MTWADETELASRRRYMCRALDHLHAAQEARRRGDIEEAKRWFDYATSLLESGEDDVRIIHEVASEPLPSMSDLITKRKKEAA